MDRNLSMALHMLLGEGEREREKIVYIKMVEQGDTTCFPYTIAIFHRKRFLARRKHKYECVSWGRRSCVD